MSNQDDKVNWVSVIHFLEKQYTQISIREREWKYQKEILTQRISTLQAELRSNSIVCEDLVKRIRVLQVALKDEKAKKSTGKNNIDTNEIKALMEKLNLSRQIEKDNHQTFLKQIVKDLKFPDKQPLKLIQQCRQQGFKVNGSGKKISERKKFGAHLDVITSIVPIEGGIQQLFATCSEDCLIKIWNLSTVLKEDQPQPKFTLRKHTGPLFALAAGTNPSNSSEQLLFSGGIEGDIKSWRIDRESEWNGSWMNSSQQQQTIWDLQMNKNNLLSVSSDGFARLFRINQGGQTDLALLKEFKQKQFNHISIQFVSEDLFLAGCSNAPRIHLWDNEGRLCQKFLYENQKGKEPSAVQANRLQIMKENKLIVGGCEDGFLRCFDYSSGKIIKKMQCEGSITSLLTWDSTIVCGSHKGTLSIWDSRMFTQIQTKQSFHLQKYDTGITSLSRTNNLILSGGADGIVKVFT